MKVASICFYFVVVKLSLFYFSYKKLKAQFYNYVDDATLFPVSQAVDGEEPELLLYVTALLSLCLPQGNASNISIR